jgi:hypothetical protein
MATLPLAIAIARVHSFFSQTFSVVHIFADFSVCKDSEKRAKYKIFCHYFCGLCDF